ncbi:MAG: L-seryl-tRNA(Sec) selenium transferase [bacterium]
MTQEIAHSRSNLRSIPSVDKVLNSSEIKGLLNYFPRWLILMIIRTVLDELRKDVTDMKDQLDQDTALRKTIGQVMERIDSIQKTSLRPVINGTGIIIHTNLGRAPLPDEALDLIKEVAKGYSNLEYDLSEGRRGKRFVHIHDLLLRLTGAREAFAVNNNAGAVLLALNSLAEGREVIVSRGELVEIGGSFRIPDVMRKSGALMREVGTTNRTHLSDYERSITDQTALLLKVHTSNYRIMGFSAEVSLQDLVELGRRHDIPVMIDLGSGNLSDLSVFGLKGEPTIQQILSTGADIVTFSGDKLLGGPQAGIILTQGHVTMGPIKSNPLARALRIDKLTLAALEATLLLYQKRDYVSSIPVLRMINLTFDEIKSRAKACLAALEEVNRGMMKLSILEDISSVGGGALPGESIPTCVIGFERGMISVDALDEAFRVSSPSVVGRIQDGAYRLDLRTIGDEDVPVLVRLYEQIVNDSLMK